MVDSILSKRKYFETPCGTRRKSQTCVILAVALVILFIKIKSIIDISSRYSFDKNLYETMFHSTFEDERVNKLPHVHSDVSPARSNSTSAKPIPSRSIFDPEKPWFIFHVGPPKTGSTTIQCGLEENSAELSREDNYYFIGKECPFVGNKMKSKNETGPFHPHGLAYSVNSGGKRQPDLRYLKNQLNYHLNHRHHVIFSCEAFSNSEVWEHKREAWEILMPLLEPWNVVVVVTYRRYYELAPSQAYHMPHNSLVLRNPNWLHKLPKKDQLPSYAEQRNDRSSVIGYIEKDMEVINSTRHKKRKRYSRGDTDDMSWAREIHKTVNALYEYERLFTNVTLFNIHEQGDLVTNFICHALPTADKTCAILKDRTAFTRPSNPSTSLDRQKLATAAYDKGLIDKLSATVPSKHLLQLIIQEKFTEFYNRTNTIPRICASVSLEEKTLNVSLAIEEYLVPKLLHISPYAEFEHRAGFALAMKKDKFCEIDTEAMLRDPRWQDFFNPYSPKNP